MALDAPDPATWRGIEETAATREFARKSMSLQETFLENRTV
jgi:hypothetical protein